MEVGLVRKVDIDHEMQQSYLDYAMSVIVARALPDARDGLKPVQRRILYAMYDMGLRADSSFKKSARVVGEVMGKYHPHGDVAVYEAMARLAQDFTLRYPLVDGQGNFGSVDGDPPAAMRYTEARLTPLAIEMLAQIERNTINFTRNFDDTLDEPVVLPAALPNLLVNGANGIAVGMATNIPPHNLGEVVDALSFMLRSWEKLDDLAVQDLMRFIQGPDFPTGGIILQEEEQNELLTAYATGKGRITVRGKVHAEEMGRGRARLIISELPYLVNKTSLQERIAELVREGDLEGIADLRDESDRQGMRIVIELKQTADVEQVLRELYQKTPLQTTFGIMLLALVDDEPRLLTLKQALRVYLEHRLEVARRRSEFDLARAKERAHILEGLRIAINRLDEVIALIRNSPDVDTARTRLMKQFKLSELQAQAILDMQLRRLAALERKKLETEYKEVIQRIKELEALLKSPKKMRQLVEDELLRVKQTYTDRRRTQIVSLKQGKSVKALLTTADVTPAREVWIGILADGTIARSVGDDTSRLSGRQAPRWLLKTSTHHTLYLVTQEGKAAAVVVESIPETEKFVDGIPLHKAAPLREGDKLAGIFSTPRRSGLHDGQFILTVSKTGLVKKSLLLDLPGPSAQTFTLVKINSGDELIWLGLTDGKSEILLVSAQGMAIRFTEQEVRPMGLAAAGVNGIKLKEGDYVVGVEKILSGEEVLLLAWDGYGWRTPDSEFPLQGRYGQGVLACRLVRGRKLVGILVGKRTQNGIVHFQKAAAKLARVDIVDLGNRTRKAQQAIEIKEGDRVISITPIIDGLAFWEKKPAGRKRKSQ